MPLIHADQWGLWVAAGGWVARPLNIKTRFLEGDEVATRHFAGSSSAGVGKDATCGRGKYLETWTTTGMSASELLQRKLLGNGKTLTDDMIAATIEFYTRWPNPKLHWKKATKDYYAARSAEMTQDPEFQKVLERLRGFEEES